MNSHKARPELDRLRVCMLHSNITRRNGEAASFIDLTLALMAGGVDVSVLSQYCTGPEYRLGILRGKAAQRVGIPPSLVKKSPLPPPTPPSGWRHSVGRVFDFVPGQGPGVVKKQLRSADLVIAKNLLPADAIKQIRNLSRGPVVFNHAGDLRAFEKYRIDVIGRPRSRTDLYTEIMQQYDYIMCQSNAIADEIADKKPELRPKLVTLAPTVDENLIRCALNSSNPFAEGTQNIVCVGSIQKRKNQLALIRGLARLLRIRQSFHLHFIGKPSEPDYYEACHKLSRSERVDSKIHFHGHKDSFLDYVVHADAFSMTSTAEGFPRVIREAMAVGTPILTHNLPGIRDYLAAYKTFIPIDEDDPTSLEAAATLILDDTIYAKQIGKSALEVYREHLAPSRYRSAAVSLITIMAGQGNRRSSTKPSRMRLRTTRD